MFKVLCIVMCVILEPKSLKRFVDVAGSPFYRLNDQKTLEWLEERYNRLLEKFDGMNLISNPQLMGSSEEERMVYRQNASYRIIAECLNDTWSKMLKEHLK
jgi:hypothetical protein